MRDYTLQAMIGLPRLTAGRRMLALERMAAKVSHVARAAPLVDPITDAITAQSTALLVLSTWYRAQRELALHEPAAKETRLVITRAVSSFHGALEGFIGGPKPEMARLARELLEDLFPRGLRGNTTLPWVDQHKDIERILARLDAEDLLEHRVRLPIDEYVEWLRELNPVFGERLTRPAGVTFAVAKAARDEAEAAFSAVFVMVCAIFHRNDPQDVAARKQLLDPVFDQIEQLSMLRATRRAAKLAAAKVAAEKAEGTGPAAAAAASPAVDAEAEALAEEVALDLEEDQTAAVSAEGAADAR